MMTAAEGDKVQVHYVKRYQDGSSISSRGREPLELTVGTRHPRLPGLGLSLVGLAPGNSVSLLVAAEQAYGLRDPARVRRVSRTRFAEHPTLPIGKWLPVQNHHGRKRLVRIVDVKGSVVVVDTNHRKAGQSIRVEIELLAIQKPES